LSIENFAAPEPSGLKSWLYRLLHPVTPGMVDRSPRAKWWLVLVMLGLIAVQTIARYKWGFLASKEYQLVHIGMGWATVLTLIALVHGPGVLRRVRPKTWFIYGLAAVVLYVFWTHGRMDGWRRHWADGVSTEGHFAPIYPFMYFASCAFVMRLLLPFTTLWLGFKTPPSELGLSARRNSHKNHIRRVWVVYLLLFIGVMPFVVWMATKPEFQAKYPMSKAMVTPEGGIALEHFLVFEMFYILIFLSGESFWRGFLNFGGERDLGLYTLVLMVVPYVTGHYGKPMPETLGAIAAGMTLGFLALKHRSIWLGFALHYGIALAMDLLAIDAKGIVIYLE
jgi:hypothetical protein